jgi:ketosteroid isomerase-like protein
MLIKCLSINLILLLCAAAAWAQGDQNTNSSGPSTRTRTVAPKPTPTPTPKATPAPAKTEGTTDTTPRPKTNQTAGGETAAGSGTVLAAFNRLLDGIRHADVQAVTSAYQDSPRLILFNNNGTVTRGWEQMKQNREASYPELKDIKLDVRDVRVTVLGRDAALVTCLWTQSQTFHGTPESATGRMTIVFQKFGVHWKAIHLHTSPDTPNPARVMPSEQAPPMKP